MRRTLFNYKPSVIIFLIFFFSAATVSMKESSESFNNFSDLKHFCTIFRIVTGDYLFWNIFFKRFVSRYKKRVQHHPAPNWFLIDKEFFFSNFKIFEWILSVGFLEPSIFKRLFFVRSVDRAHNPLTGTLRWDFDHYKIWFSCFILTELKYTPLSKRIFRFFRDKTFISTQMYHIVFWRGIVFEITCPELYR